MSTTPATRIGQQLEFLREIDALKGVVRASPLINNSRRENTAEHSWHVTMYALILAPAAPFPIDVNRVITMLMIHDIVEIDAGDTPIHGGQGLDEQAAREQQAADRLFGILPTDQRTELRAIWDEFEAAETNDARFAKALDRMQPLIQSIHAGGGTWTESDVSEEQVYERYGPVIRRGSEELWEFALELVRQHFSN